MTIDLQRVSIRRETASSWTSVIRATCTKCLPAGSIDLAPCVNSAGLNGFLLRTESEHDCYGAGHAGTALSAALGMAVGRDLRGSDENIVVVAGDAAFTCGISYEALNNVKAHTKRFIVVLNDTNGRSPKTSARSQIT